MAERGGQRLGIVIRRTGDVSKAVSVDYYTDDGSTPSVTAPCLATTGLALERCDYTGASGAIHFVAGENFKNFTVLVNDDSYVEGAETTRLRLSNLTGGAVLGSQAEAVLQIDDDFQESTGNPNDEPEKFVRQHYADFLNRAPDAGGLAFWTGVITECGANAACIDNRRQNVSAAYFLSGAKTRGQALQAVAEDSDLVSAEFRRAFVAMQYFGYLRRDPDQSGFDFWLGKLNNHGGDFIGSEMVRSFIVSGEYRGRFGQ